MNLIRKAQKAKTGNKVKLRVVIEVIDLGDGKEDVIVSGPFGGSEKAKIMTINVIAGAMMKICQHQDQKIQTPSLEDINKIKGGVH